MLRSDFICIDFDPSEVLLRPKDLCVVGGATITADGLRLEVPLGMSGFVAYGPYTQLPSGIYDACIEIDPYIEQTDRQVRFEVFSAGSIICDELVVQGHVSRFVVGNPVGGLEFRIKSDGKAFALLGITIKQIVGQPAELSFRSEPVSCPPCSHDLELVWRLLNINSKRFDFGEMTENEATISPQALNQWDAEFSKCTEIDLSSEELLHRSALQLFNHGLSVSALRIARTDRLETQKLIMEQFDPTGQNNDFKREIAAREDKFSNPFLKSLSTGDGVEQYTSSRHGMVSCACPYTGELITSRHAFCVDMLYCVYILYRFDGANVFYVACGGFQNKRAFMYLPNSNILIHLSPQNLFSGPFADVVRKFKYFSIAQAVNIKKYLSSETRPALMTGTIKNLGHFVWNELAGAFRFNENGLLKNIAVGVGYRARYFDTFDLLNRCDLDKFDFDSPDTLFEGMVSNQLFPVLPTSLRVEPRMARLLIDRALSTISNEDKAEILQARKSKRLIYFNLRVHNKSWVEQIDGALTIARRSVAEGASMSIYLDGMRDCAEAATEIKRQAPNGVSIYMGFEKPLQATVAWATASDAYVATIGSGLTLLTWIAGKPGVAHSEHHHLTQRFFWPEVRPDVPPPVVIEEADVNELRSGSYGNYSISPEKIADLLWPLLDA